MYSLFVVYSTSMKFSINQIAGEQPLWSVSWTILLLLVPIDDIISKQPIPFPWILRRTQVTWKEFFLCLNRDMGKLVKNGKGTFSVLTL